ncbi:hypothetical protein [Ferruginibacter sp. SUN106]|uniref:hypothetical protein n=1 Tax=Ferruginibacter sp. SUN106 TaxID=2978348 RepID=UPI003D3630EF
MNYIIITYCLYLTITIALTIWVARTLFKNGKVFLVDIFHGNKELADSVNNLLLVGFYLVNIGYAVYTLQVTSSITNFQEVIEKLSVKVGFIILILGAMHFFNLYIFFTLRKKATMEKRFKTNVIS